MFVVILLIVVIVDCSDIPLTEDAANCFAIVPCFNMFRVFRDVVVVFHIRRSVHTQKLKATTCTAQA